MRSFCSQFKTDPDDILARFYVFKNGCTKGDELLNSNKIRPHLRYFQYTLSAAFDKSRKKHGRDFTTRDTMFGRTIVRVTPDILLYEPRKLSPKRLTKYARIPRLTSVTFNH